MSMSTGWRRRVARSFAALCFLFSIAEAKDAPYEVATITGSVISSHTFLNRLDERTVITSIDRIPVAVVLLVNANTTQTLKPGRHFIHVRYTHGRWNSNGRLWVDAEAGKAYLIHAREEGSGVRFWIENKASGAIVGGVDTGDDDGKDGPATPPPVAVPVSMPAATPAPAPVPVAAEETAAAGAKPAAPEYSLATITGYVSKNNVLFGPAQRIHITCIDDIDVADVTLPYHSNKQTLMAGKHHICVDAVANRAHSTGKFWLEAEPGKNYLIHSRTAGYDMYFWVEDTDTHQAVPTSK
jgi:hypothetical protein